MQHEEYEDQFPWAFVWFYLMALAVVLLGVWRYFGI